MFYLSYLEHLSYISKYKNKEVHHNISVAKRVTDDTFRDFKRRKRVFENSISNNLRKRQTVVYDILP